MSVLHRGQPGGCRPSPVRPDDAQPWQPGDEAMCRHGRMTVTAVEQGRRVDQIVRWEPMTT